MRFGACIGMDAYKLQILKDAGYDYAETSASGIALASQEDFDAFCAESQRIGMPVEASNCFVPSEIKLVGADRDDKKISEYIDLLMSRLSKLGVKTAVFGSSGARKAPEGVSIEQARKEIVEFLKNIAGPKAAERGITIAIEPLCSKEDNCINTVHDGVEIVNAVNLPGVRVLADIYHMLREEEDFDYLKTLGGVLLHAHTSSPSNGNGKRLYMIPGDGYSQLPFISAINAAGCPRCSVEAGTEDFAADAPQSIKVMKEALAQADKKNLDFFGFIVYNCSNGCDGKK